MRLIPAILAVVIFASQAASKETWRGLVVAPENRCSDYASDDYTYPQSVEREIVEAMGNRIYGPYTGTCFSSTQETDIEHIVARSEAHDSGLCSADAETKRNFARDPLNLTLASPSVNRHQKSGKDAADWLPGLNQCWYAERTVQVRAKYGLTIDQREADALERVLSGCESTAMVFIECTPGQLGHVEQTRAAAEQDPARALPSLGLGCESGEDGVPKDYVKAYAWYIVAAAQGHEEVSALKDSLREKMTTEQWAEAEELAAEFRDGIESSELK